MVETSIISVASETIGKHRPKKQAWTTNEILDLCDERRTLKSTVKSNLNRRNEYNILNPILKRMINKNKEEWIQEQCNSINEDMSRNLSNKRAYKTLIMLTKPNHKKMMIIFDKNDKPLADNNGLMQMWTEYCNELYNYPIGYMTIKETITSQHIISLL